MKASIEQLKEKLAPADKLFKTIFKLSSRDEVRKRKGVVVFLDDRPEQLTMLENLFKIKNINVPIVSFQDIEKTRTYITERGQDSIRVAVIDVEIGEKDSRELLEWMQEFYPDIPIVICTGNIELKEEIESQFPNSEVFIKGQHTIEDLADALALPRSDSSKTDFLQQVLPTEQIASRPKSAKRFFLSLGF